MRRPRTERVAPVVFLLLSAAFVLTASPLPARASAVPLTGKFIMAFLACNTSVSNCSNPQNHLTYLAESNDSVAWSMVSGFKPYHGSVPDAIRRGSTVYIYNPGTMVRFHLDTGVEDSPTPVSLKFSNGTSAIFVDPSVFLDAAGALHLFYLPGMAGQDPAQCPAGQSSCTKQIMSATEVAGSDGGSFLVDPGTRVDFTVSQCCFSDPAVFQGPSDYYLYVSEGQAVLAFDSPTLTGSYTSVQGLSGAILVQQGTGGVPAGYYDSSSRMFWTFVTQGSTVAVIARSSTASISSPIGSSSFSAVLSGCSLPSLGCSFAVESPGFHLNTVGPTTTTSTSSSTSSTALPSVSSTTSTSTSFVTSSSTTTASISLSTGSTTSTPILASLTTLSTTASSSTSSTPTEAAVSSSSSSTTSASGGIPEFPFQLLVAPIFAVLLVAAYLLARRHQTSDGMAGLSKANALHRGT